MFKQENECKRIWIKRKERKGEVNSDFKNKNNNKEANQLELQKKKESNVHFE